LALAGLALVTVLYVGTTPDALNPDVKHFPIHLPYIEQPTPTVRIFCLILTSPVSFATRAKAVNDTWASRCDRYYFVTEYAQENLTAQQLNASQQLPIAPIPNITAGYDHLTRKSNLALLFAHDQHLNDFDWFVKADDDTYLIVDHLRDFLSEQNASEPVTFGYNFKVTSRLLHSTVS
jgi:glycoprotein-N-acetylgalactosamine 3-beta-galactosyltransferase